MALDGHDSIKLNISDRPVLAPPAPAPIRPERLVVTTDPAPLGGTSVDSGGGHELLMNSKRRPETPKSTSAASLEDELNQLAFQPAAGSAPAAPIVAAPTAPVTCELKTVHAKVQGADNPLDLKCAIKVPEAAAPAPAAAMKSTEPAPVDPLAGTTPIAQATTNVVKEADANASAGWGSSVFSMFRRGEKPDEPPPEPVKLSREEETREKLEQAMKMPNM